MMIFYSYYEEACMELDNQRFDVARELYIKSNGYENSNEKIKESYYIQGLSVLKEGDKESAKMLFEKAGDFKDAIQQIIQIEAEEKETLYIQGKDAYEKKDYQNAIELLKQIRGYKDAETMLQSAMVADVENKIEDLGHIEEFDSDEREKLFKMLSALSILEDDTSKNMRKKIHYILGKSYSISGMTNDAKSHLEQAIGYEDANDLLLKILEKTYDGYILSGEHEKALKYYKEELVPLGYDKKPIVAIVGDNGNVVKEVLSLTKALITNAKIPNAEDKYLEDYMPYIMQMKKYFGYIEDSDIYLDEYIDIHNMLYVGCSGDRVKELLEYIVDLGYIAKLPDTHNVYEQSYIKGIKKAEKAFELEEDGIITLNEFNDICSKKVDMPEKPSNLTAKVNKDTVTVSWNKVPGAVMYEVKTSEGLLGVTEKTSWVDKGVRTGRKIYYKVRAMKYTVSGEYASERVSIPRYYKSINASQLVEDRESLVGKYVIVNNLKINDWIIVSSDGTKSKAQKVVSDAKTSYLYDLELLCSANDLYIIILIEHYGIWDWGKSDQDFLTMIKKIKTISVKGIVSTKTDDMNGHEMLPVVMVANSGQSERLFRN